MIIQHRACDKHQNSDSFSKKTEFHERLEEKLANQAEIMDSFSFLDKDTCDSCHTPDGLKSQGIP